MLPGSLYWLALAAVLWYMRDKKKKNKKNDRTEF